MHGLKNCFCLVTVVAFAAILSACAGFDHTRHFKEEVRLQTGEIIIVDRKFAAEELGGIGTAGGYEPTYESLEIVQPKLEKSPPKWESTIGLIPMILERGTEGGGWTLLATFYTCESWVRLGRPKFPYAEFRFLDAEWRQVDFSTRWVGREANVLTSIPLSGVNSPVTLAYKDNEMSDPQIFRQYSRIIDDWQNNCAGHR